MPQKILLFALVTVAAAVAIAQQFRLLFAAGVEKKDLEIKMTPQGVIIGRVIDQDGDPIANAQIAVARYGYDGGRRALIPAGVGFAGGGANADPAAQAAAAQALL